MLVANSLFDFVFRETADAHFDELRQGDLLLKTDSLAEAISQGHRHYADNPDYTHFLVLTQSCDLAMRRGGICRADYLTICAVKPLDRFLEKKLTGVFHPHLDPLRLGRKDLQRSAKSVIEKLISNTHSEVFYLDRGCAQSLVESSCAFLQLSIALRPEHFDALRRAKQAEMSDVFAAKLGWMTGNLYSRVGTPDIYEEHPDDAQTYADDLITRTLAAETWLSDREFKKYSKSIKQINAQQGQVTRDDARNIIKSLPTDLDELTDAIVGVLRKNKFELDEGRLRQIRFRMINDQAIKRLASSNR